MKENKKKGSRVFRNLGIPKLETHSEVGDFGVQEDFGVQILATTVEAGLW